MSTRFSFQSAMIYFLISDAGRLTQRLHPSLLPQGVIAPTTMKLLTGTVGNSHDQLST